MFSHQNGHQREKYILDWVCISIPFPGALGISLLYENLSFSLMDFIMDFVVSFLLEEWKPHLELNNDVLVLDTKFAS